MEPIPGAAAPAPAVESAEPTEGQGYVIEVAVKGDGTFTVSKKPAAPEVAQVEGAESVPGAAADQTFSSLGEMLKGVMAIVNENPVSGSEQTQFDAGFGGESPMAKKY